MQKGLNFNETWPTLLLRFVGHTFFVGLRIGVFLLIALVLRLFWTPTNPDRVWFLFILSLAITSSQLSKRRWTLNFESKTFLLALRRIYLCDFSLVSSNEPNRLTVTARADRAFFYIQNLFYFVKYCLNISKKWL